MFPVSSTPQDKVEERNNDYLKIIRNLKFSNTSTAASMEGRNSQPGT